MSLMWLKMFKLRKVFVQTVAFLQLMLTFNIFLESIPHLNKRHFDLQAWQSLAIGRSLPKVHCTPPSRLLRTRGLISVMRKKDGGCVCYMAMSVWGMTFARTLLKADETSFTFNLKETKYRHTFFRHYQNYIINLNSQGIL